MFLVVVTLLRIALLFPFHEILYNFYVSIYLHGQLKLLF